MVRVNKTLYSQEKNNGESNTGLSQRHRVKEDFFETSGAQHEFFKVNS